MKWYGARENERRRVHALGCIRVGNDFLLFFESIQMKFAKVFDVKRYEQILLLKEQSEDGNDQIRVHFQPEGHGVCSFVVGFNEDHQKKTDSLFDEVTPQDAIALVDSFMFTVAHGKTEGGVQ